MWAGHCKNACKNRRAARAKVKKRNETWEKTQHQPQTSGQMGVGGRERGEGIRGVGRCLPSMAPARATRCGSSAASIEIPNNRVECTCTACATTRHKKNKVNEREENPKTKMLWEKMQKCATKRSEKRGRVGGGENGRWWVEPSKRGSATAQSWRSEMQQPRHLHALQ